MRTPHTHCSTGTTVEIKLKDETLIVGKFYERKGRFLELLDGRKIDAGKIRSFRRRRGPQPETQ